MFTWAIGLCGKMSRLYRTSVTYGLSAGVSLPWAAGTLGSSWAHAAHPSLQSQQSLYDPMSQSHGRLHPRLHELAEDQLYASGRSQSPESGSWYNVPFGDPALPSQPGAAVAGPSTGVQYQHRRPAAEQAVQPQVAVRDSSVEFDMDTGFSDDDDAPPPLPAEPPPGSVSTSVPLAQQFVLLGTTSNCYLCPACSGWT